MAGLKEIFDRCRTSRRQKYIEAKKGSTASLATQAAAMRLTSDELY